MKAFKNYYKKSLLFSSLFLIISCGQKSTKWEEIILWDLGNTEKYIDFGISNISPDKIGQYSPTNLFDADFKTCFVCGLTKNTEKSSIYLKLSGNRNKVLNIFSGYGKSKDLYIENARPKKIKLSIYAAINPEAYVSELGIIYKALKYEKEQTVELTDSFGVKSISLDFSQDALTDFLDKASASYSMDYDIPKAEICLILKLKIIDTYVGTKYEDVCISELFFTDRFITKGSSISNKVLKVYLDENENTLLLDKLNKKGLVIYTDQTSVLQLIDISKDKKWAILIAMPLTIQGRVETKYLLVDLKNKEIINTKLEERTGNYLSGNEMYFEPQKKDFLYLKYLAKDGEYYKLELK